MKTMIMVGTRPEAIKLAPVVLALQQDKRFHVQLVSTGQHREMLDQVLGLFGLKPHLDLHLMKPNQQLCDLNARALQTCNQVFKQEQPDLVLVQGDTTSAMAAGLSAFYRRIPVGHVEAGLRTFDKWHPFPEEINRRILSSFSDYNFAPTETSKKQLIKEGVDPKTIYMTGNTVIDALLWVRERLSDDLRMRFHRPGKKLVLMTAHRRESFGEPLQDICQAVLKLAAEYPDLWFLYPVHKNPNVRNTVFGLLSNNPQIELVEPLDYQELVAAMDQAHFILTDSGGIQEEAPSLHKPVLVLRKTSERMEAVQAGSALLVGRDPEKIHSESARLLTDGAHYARMKEVQNPFGDGKAALYIRDALLDP